MCRCSSQAARGGHLSVHHAGLFFRDHQFNEQPDGPNDPTRPAVCPAARWSLLSFLREGTKDGKVVLVSSCSYWETDNIDLLLAQAKALRGFAGAVLRPHGGRLKTYDGDEYAG